MPKHTFIAEQTIDITPFAVAELFAQMDADQQALFFNEVALIVKRDFEGTFEYQMQNVTDSVKLL